MAPGGGEGERGHGTLCTPEGDCEYTISGPGNKILGFKSIRQTSRCTDENSNRAKLIDVMYRQNLYLSLLFHHVL